MSAPLTQSEIVHFEETGYVVVPNLFAPSDLTPLRDEISQIIADTAERLFAEGRIVDRHENEGFETRLTRLLRDNPDQSGAFFRAIEGKGGGGHSGRAMFDLLTHPVLLDAMEQLVGEEIVASSVYRIRPKIPGLGRGVVPWHQDSGYFAPHCDNDLIVTCWIPLVDVTPENGCLQVAPCAHRQGVMPHRSRGPNGFLIIPDEDLPQTEIVTVPVPLGGALLLTNLAPHCSTPNATDVIRWSVDLRYQGRNAPTNAFQTPEDFDLHAPLTEIACYPPEGDFVVRSRKAPETVHDYDQYVRRRAQYEAVSLPVPGRSWEVWDGAPS